MQVVFSQHKGVMEVLLTKNSPMEICLNFFPEESVSAENLRHMRSFD